MRVRSNGRKIFLAIALIGASVLMAPSVVAGTVISKSSTPAELRAYIKEVDQRLQMNPLPKDYGYKGQALEFLGDSAGAVQAFTKKLELAPNDRVALYRRAENYKKLGRHKESFADYNKLVSNGENQSFVYSGRSIVRTILKDPDGGLLDSERAIALDSNDKRAWFAKGFAQFAKKSGDAGVAAFSESIRLDPACTECWEMRADAYSFVGKTKESKFDRKHARTLGAREQ